MNPIAAAGALLALSMGLPRAAEGGYWRMGTPEITQRHASPSQYGHEYIIVSFGSDRASLNYRDGLSGNRTLLDVSWTVPGVIVPGEVPPATAAYKVSGPKLGGFMMRFDLPNGTTDGGLELVSFTLGPNSPSAGKLANTKGKAPLTPGDRAIHLSVGLTGGLDCRLRIPYQWVEGEAPPPSAGPAGGNALLDGLESFFESLADGALKPDEASRRVEGLRAKAEESWRGRVVSRAFFDRYARILRAIRLVFVTAPDDPEASAAEAEIGRFVKDALGQPWNAEAPVSEKIGDFSRAVASEIAALRAGPATAGPSGDSTAEPLQAGEPAPPPKFIERSDPVYPEKARAERVEGIVILEALVDPGGRVTRVTVIRPVQGLDRAAVEAVGRWKFEPTVVGGLPRELVLRVTVNFPTMKVATSFFFRK